MWIGVEATFRDARESLASGIGISAGEECVHEEVAAGAAECSKGGWAGYRGRRQDHPRLGDVVGCLTARGVGPVDHDRPTSREHDVVGVQVEVRELLAAPERRAQPVWC